MSVTSKQRRKLATLCSLLALSGLILGAQAVSQSPGDKPAEKAKRATVNDLGGANRFLTHLSTDKPMYKPGETMYLRAVLLHHQTRKPLPKNAQAIGTITVEGPKGDKVASGWLGSQDSVAGFSWKIPKDLAGGEYTAKVAYPQQGYTAAERKFDIRVYRAPRMKSQIKFLRDGYGPSDKVAATLNVTRAEGGVPAGARVTYTARVDGQQVAEGKTNVDDEGNAVAKFQLPDDIRRGEGTLAMVIEDGGVIENASKTIPILLQTVDLTMYPEGGDLVAGLPARVYYEAFTPAKKPADLAGEIVDGEGNVVTKFRSKHEGRGQFGFTPETDQKYTMRITEPSGIDTVYPLPEVKSNGGSLRTLKNVYAAEQPIEIKAGLNTEGKFSVSLSHRETELGRVSQKTTEVGKLTKISFTPPQWAAGVLTVTLWDANDRPLAERLLFRQPSGSLQVAIDTDSAEYTPGGKVKVTLKTTNEDDEPVPAVVGVTITDDSILEMIEKRDQAPRLPVMVLLENDVLDLADAHVYLDPENPDAEVATDLLLGTQGWRRFALMNTAKFMGEHGDKARRALALRLATVAERSAGLGGGAFHFGRGGIAPGAGFDAFALDDDILLDGAAPVPAGAIPKAAPALAQPLNNAQDAIPEILAEDDGEIADEAVDQKNDQPAAPAAPPLAVDHEGGDDNVDGIEDLERAIAPAEEELAPAAEAPADLFGDEPVAANQLFRQEAKTEQAKKILRELQAGEARRKRGLIAPSEPNQPIANDFVAVRVFAHQLRPDHQPGVRRDFTETVYWHAGVRTNDKGEASFEFFLNDAVTSFRATADAYSADGAVATAGALIESVEPFYLEPKLPLEVTAGDHVRVPVGLVNATNSSLSEGSFTVVADTGAAQKTARANFELTADQRLRKLVSIKIGAKPGEAAFTLDAIAGGYKDKVTRKMQIKPLGFPIEEGFGGLIGPGLTATHELTIPESLVSGSLKSRILVYPTPLASMNEALARLIREPYGCFEQTSSTTYPLVMAQQYFMSHQGVDPSLIERSASILDKGYNRLIGFESKGGGFEWFGNDPGHDALTAYGIMQFTDMSQVRTVDSAMLARTTDWLLKQRDGKGGFTRKTHTLHTWLAEPEVAFPYDTWALLSAKVDADLSAEIKWAREAGEATDNSYVLALAANIMVLGGDKEGEEHFLDRLAGKQNEDGSLKDATTSVVGSGGDALKIETTSLAALAWLNNPSYTANVEKSIKFLAENCKAGRFGSTQSTILALKAIVAYDAARAKPKAPGTLQLSIDGKQVGEPVAFTADTQGTIELPLTDALTAGDHKIQLTMEDGSEMPYSIAIDYNSEKPNSSEQCKLHLEAELAETKIVEGNNTNALVTVVNRSGEKIPTPTAIIGIPGGLEVRHDQLKELVAAEKIAAYEVIGREVVLYWLAMLPEQRVELSIDLVAAVPGKYTGPASRAYLYYTDEHKMWVDGLKATITPRQK